MLKTLTALQIGFDLRTRLPNRPHLLVREQRQLIVDVLRSWLRPVSVSEQCLGMNRLRKFYDSKKCVPALRHSFSVDNRAKVGGADRPHHAGRAVCRKVSFAAAQPHHITPFNMQGSVP